MKPTLVEIVKDIMSFLSSDEIESIWDSTESEQVLGIVRYCYNFLMTEREWEHQKSGLVTSPYGTLYPTHCKIEDNVHKVNFVKYNVKKAYEDRDQYRPVQFKDVDSFLRYTNGRNSLSDNIQSITDFSGIQFLIKTDADPSYYTSFDDKFIVFDSYDSTSSDTIMSSRIQGSVYLKREWRDEDNFVPDMPEEFFPLLITTATRMAMINLKQTDNPLLAINERRSRGSMAVKGWTVADRKAYPNYGRCGPKGRN